MINKFDKVKLGKRIRQLRNAKGLSQNDLCAKLNMEPSMLSNFETGKNAPTLSTLVKIVNALEVDFNQILDYSHLENDNKIEEKFIEAFKNLPLEKKQFLFRVLNFLNELN